MQLDKSTFAVGFIAGLGSLLAIIFIIQIGAFEGALLCAGDESALSCARDWSNAFAIVAASVTILFLAREQRFQREIAVLQTLDLRKQVVQTRRTIRRLMRLAQEIRTTERRWRDARTHKTRMIQPLYLAKTIIDIERALRDENLTGIVDLDQHLADNVDEVLFEASTLINRFFPDDNGYARSQPHNLTVHMISEHWNVDIDPIELESLATSVEAVATTAFEFADHLTAFRATEWLNKQRGKEG